MIRSIASLIAVAALVGACAATDTGQGQAEQGGSVDHAPLATGFMFVFGDSSITSTPTAAPAATSKADSKSSATQATTLDPAKAAEILQAMGVPAQVAEQAAAAIKAKAAADKKVPVIGGEPAPAPAPEPTPAPGDGQ